MINNEQDFLYMLGQGSEYAFRELFNTYKNHVYKVAMIYVKQSTVAEEIVQDVFLKVWLNKDQFKEIKSFESWLYTVARNIIINRYKSLISDHKKKNNYAQILHQEENLTYSHVLNKEYETLLQRGLSLLPKQQKEVYQLVREQGLSYKEAAELLQISPLTVKTHMARAMNFLRNFIKEAASLFLYFILFY